MACTTPFDVLRLKVEDLGPVLYRIASWQNPILSVIPRSEYPVGAGLTRSAFTIGRSEPDTDEETWDAIQNFDTDVNGACTQNYTQAYVGFKENQYAPESFGLVGPLICQDQLTIDWESAGFWGAYFQQLQKRSETSLSNRQLNVYMNYSTKVVAATNGTYTEVAGNIATQPPGASVNMSGVPTPTCGLTQDLLDIQAVTLTQLGANNPNSSGWITWGPSGPVYSLQIGMEASNQLALNNAELRDDYRSAFMGWGDANPVIQRLGASRIIKNFRHVISLFPPRWGYRNGALYRVPTWLNSTSSTNATGGKVPIVNPDYLNANIAGYEGAIVLNPWVMTEEILRPVNSVPGQNWTPQNYMGDWRFVTGNDAVLGFDDCTGIKDPLHTRGRHFARYRHANKPLFPTFGRLILFKRCPNIIDCATCS